MASRRICTFGLAAVLAIALASPAGAAVSILAVDRETGEVGIAGASCVQFDLARVATVVPGVGVAVSQGDQRLRDPFRLRAALRRGDSPSEAIESVAGVAGSEEMRQYAVVTLRGGASTRSAPRMRPASAEARGNTVAVLGFELSRRDVVRRARAAFVHAQGGLARRLLAGLAASSAAGGDRRCGRGQTATAAFVIVATAGRQPVVPIRGLPGAADRRREVLEMVGPTVAADELAELIIEAAALRHPEGPGAPEVYLSFIQPRRAFDAVMLLAQAYEQLQATPTPTPSVSPVPSLTASPAAAPASEPPDRRLAYIGLVLLGVLVLAAFTGRIRRRDGDGARARTWAGFIWTLPNTLIGLVLGLLTFQAPRMTAGAIVFDRAPRGVSWLLSRADRVAMTVGFVIVSARRVQGTLLAHERHHIRQFCAWGPLFIPVYLLLALVYGYQGHPFELRARRAAGEVPQA